MRSGVVAALVSLLLAAPPAAPAAAQGRERALEQIPELMERILDSQEQIRAREAEVAPVVEGYDLELVRARREIEEAEGERGAAEALVSYVEAYAARLEAQEEGLRSIELAVVRMRADARDLVRAADAIRSPARESAEERRGFYADEFQGVAAATAELAGRLDREEEAAATGAVLHASWSSRSALELPVADLGPGGALAFARKAEALYARFQARSSQLRAERRAVRRLLDLLIQRQLGHRLDALFADGDARGLGSLLASGGGSQDWQDLGSVVGRALGLPAAARHPLGRGDAELDRLDRFARGEHRE
jgi:hypothetical protein